MKHPITAILTALLCMILSPVYGQKIDKSWVQDMARQTYLNKLRKNPAALQKLERWEDLRQELPGETDRPPRVFPRNDANLGISSTEETESEIHAAINPTDTNNLVVAAMQFGEGLLGPELTFPIYYTRDFGQTWSLSSFDGVSDRDDVFVAGGGDPVIVFDSEGVAYLSWLTLSLDLTFQVEIALHWAVSRDGGESWERQPGTIDQDRLSDIVDPEGRFVDKQWMAVDRSDSPYRDNIYIAYAEIDFQDTSYQILVKRKEAASDTIEAGAVGVSPEEFLFAQFTSIDVDSRGHVHVLYSAARAEDEVIALYHVRSEDGGKTFTSPVKISDLHLPCFPPGLSEEPCEIVGIDSARVYPAAQLRVDHTGGPADGNLYAVWTADGLSAPQGDGLDIYYSRSLDGGNSWSPARVLNDDGLAANDQFFPSLTVNELGTVVSTWYDRREDPDNLMTQYYITWSEDGGETFRSNQSASDEASDFAVIGQDNNNFGIGEYTQVVATSSYALPFWADGRTNDGNIEIFTARIPLKEGLTTSIPSISTVSPLFSVQGPYPNPADNLARLTLTLKQDSEVAISVFSINGQLIDQRDLGDLPSGDHPVDIPVSTLENGQYILVVYTDFGRRSIPMNVQR